MTWVVKTIRKLCILTYLGHDPTLTWPDLRSEFEIDLSMSKKTMFRTGWSRQTQRCHFYFCISHIKKFINEKPFRKKTIILIWWPMVIKLWSSKTIEIRSNLIEKRYGGMQEAPQRFFESFLAILEIITLACEKSLFSQSWTFGDLWWPHYWADLKMSFVKIWDLVVVYLCYLCYGVTHTFWERLKFKTCSNGSR